MEFEIKTGFGRPRKLGLVRHTTIYLYEKYGEVYKKVEELCRIEGKSFSELVSEALKEYVERHYPGNPQLTLPQFEKGASKSLRLRLQLAATELEDLLRRRPDPLYHATWRRDLLKAAIRVQSLQEKVGTRKYDQLVQEALRAAREEGEG